MYDLIPPYGSLNDVVPGTPWQPEPAARYNAVNELLKRESFAPVPESSVPGSRQLLRVCNSSGSVLPIFSPVQVDTSFIDDDSYFVHRRNCYVFGRPVEKIHGLWGIALDNIPPGEWGEVQISGLMLVEAPRGEYEYTASSPYGKRSVRNNFLFAGTDGALHFGQRGEAQVISFCPNNRRTLVRLGVRDQEYCGMFSLFENGDGTLTVRGGETDLYATYTDSVNFEGGSFIEDTVIPARNRGTVVCLVARLVEEKWRLEIVQADHSPHALYIPGEQLFWPLARYSGVDEWGYLRSFQQLWQGGVINFSERYYVE